MFGTSARASLLGRALAKEAGDTKCRRVACNVLPQTPPRAGIWKDVGATGTIRRGGAKILRPEPPGQGPTRPVRPSVPLCLKVPMAPKLLQIRAHEGRFRPILGDTPPGLRSRFVCLPGRPLKASTEMPPRRNQPRGGVGRTSMFPPDIGAIVHQPDVNRLAPAQQQIRPCFRPTAPSVRPASARPGSLLGIRLEDISRAIRGTRVSKLTSPVMYDHQRCLPPAGRMMSESPGSKFEKHATWPSCEFRHPRTP